MEEVANILQRIIFDTLDSCWGWRGTQSSRPYYNQTPATRAVWGVFGNPVPDEYELHHVCENPGCVNPYHLRPMLREEHLRNHALSKRRSTHCPHGHEWTPENTSFRQRGKYVKARDCRRCAADRMRAKRVSRG